MRVWAIGGCMVWVPERRVLVAGLAGGGAERRGPARARRGEVACGARDGCEWAERIGVESTRREGARVG